MRLDRFISNQTQYSRDETKTLIKKGFVSVDGHTIKDPSFNIDPDLSDIELNHEKITYKKEITLMLNKPKGYVSATKDHLHPTVLSLINAPYNTYDLKIVGRLDIDTEGLLLLTTNGKLVHELTSPHKHIFKTYFVEVDKDILDFEVFNQDYEIKDGQNVLYKPHKPIIKELSKRSCLFSIDEGKFHQVKRMFAYFGYEVMYLKRISIGNLVLDELLQIGEYKVIEDDVVQTIQSHENLNKI